MLAKTSVRTHWDSNCKFHPRALQGQTLLYKAVVRPPTTNESGTCIYIAIDISVYSIYGVSLGAGGKIGKISTGASVGPLKGKKLLGSKVINVTHCCCKDNK